MLGSQKDLRSEVLAQSFELHFRVVNCFRLSVQGAQMLLHQRHCWLVCKEPLSCHTRDSFGQLSFLEWFASHSGTHPSCLQSQSLWRTEKFETQWRKESCTYVSEELIIWLRQAHTCQRKDCLGYLTQHHSSWFPPRFDECCCSLFAWFWSLIYHLWQASPF